MKFQIEAWKCQYAMFLRPTHFKLNILPRMRVHVELFHMVILVIAILGGAFLAFRLVCHCSYEIGMICHTYSWNCIFRNPVSLRTRQM